MVLSYGFLYLTVTVAIEYIHVCVGSASLLQGDSGILLGATDEDAQVIQLGNIVSELAVVLLSSHHEIYLGCNQGFCHCDHNPT